MLTQLFLVLVVVLSQVYCEASYSVYFANSKDRVLNANQRFAQTPTSDMVADIIARLSGQNPLIREENINLPTVAQSQSVKTPILIEVAGGKIPSRYFNVFHAHATSEQPTIEAVSSVLQTNNINMETMKLGNIDEEQLMQIVNNLDQPAIILHRSLTSSVTPLTEFEISQYQIVLWTAIAFMFILFGAIMSIMNMEVIPDSLLTAKFQSARTVLPTNVSLATLHMKSPLY